VKPLKFSDQRGQERIQVLLRFKRAWNETDDDDIFLFEPYFPRQIHDREIEGTHGILLAGFSIGIDEVKVEHQPKVVEVAEFPFLARLLPDSKVKDVVVAIRFSLPP